MRYPHPRGDPKYLNAIRADMRIIRPIRTSAT
jgi:hypothetical protein